MTAIPDKADRPPATRADGAGSHWSRLLRACPADPAWARPALAGLLLATALLYLTGLDRNGWGNQYYAAAVQAGTENWKAFFFGSLDSGNFITTDKPGTSLWVMELSARMFGVNYWSVLVPQALTGVATVGVLYAAVGRRFGSAAGLIAGATLALTPAATLIFRLDDPDALLTLTVTLAGYAMTRAVESGRTLWVVLTGVFLGAGFLAKFMVAFMVLPALALAYLWAGPPRLARRAAQLLAGGLALLVAAGWWVAAVLLTPAADRPFTADSTDNNILNLIFGYNGFGRLTNQEYVGAPGIASASAGATPVKAAHQGPTGLTAFFNGPHGLSRLFSPGYGGYAAWLIPAALIAVAAVLWVSRRAPRTDRTRAAALLWGGWLLAAGLVLSFMTGITHSYYTVVLAPAIGALVGIGAVTGWDGRRTWFGRATLTVMLAVTGGWAWVLLGRTPGWFPWLRLAIALAAGAAACLVLANTVLARSGLRGRFRLALGASPVALGLAAALGGPLAYSVQTAATPHGGSSPSAGPSRAAAVAPRAPVPVGGHGRSTGNGASLVELLERGAPGYRWAAAVVGSANAASMELSTGGDPVMAVGGYAATDPAPPLAEFQRMVAAHEVHYFVTNAMRDPEDQQDRDVSRGNDAPYSTSAAPGARDQDKPDAVPPGGAGSDSAQVTSWVESHFTPTTASGMTVYDLAAPAS